MDKKEDKSTRYFIDLDLKRKMILRWDYGQKDTLSQELGIPFQQRVFITKGQYYKLIKKSSAQ